MDGIELSNSVTEAPADSACEERHELNSKMRPTRKSRTESLAETLLGFT